MAGGADSKTRVWGMSDGVRLAVAPAAALRADRRHLTPTELEAMAGLRHVQARRADWIRGRLLVRRLLAERVPARRMPELITGSGDEELQRMLLDGVEIVAREGGKDDEPVEAVSLGPAESWTRIRVMPGVELHLQENFCRNVSASKIKRILVMLKCQF